MSLDEKTIKIREGWEITYRPEDGTFCIPEPEEFASMMSIRMRLADAYALADMLLAVRAWGVEEVVEEQGPVDGGTNPSRYSGDRTSEG